jgi:hypothetical protein
MAKPVFHKLDESNLPDSVTSALAKKRELDRKSREIKSVIEAEMIKFATKRGHIDDTKTLLFGYNFGNFAIAIVSKDDVKRSAPKTTGLVL